MTIAVIFHMNDETDPSAITGVAGPVTDMLVPSVGDLVQHCTHLGVPFLARVTDRLYAYNMASGIDVDGSITITLSLDRVVTH